jgi:protein-disulfide isomerase
MMTRNFRLLAVALIVLAAAVPTFDRARAQLFSPDQRGEIEKIIRDYLLRNPELLQEVIQEMERRQTQADAEKYREAIRENANAIFNSNRQVVLGNPQGDVTVVEFFDYNCGFCRRALADKIELMKTDPKLRVVLKEFPVLGEGSTQAAQVAVAVRMQDKTGGKKYLEFHQKMFASRGQIDKARALAVVREIGFDAARAEKEMGSEEVRLTLEEGFKLAEALGINGTPTYVLTGQVVVGAVGVEKLREAISTVRCGKATC